MKSRRVFSGALIAAALLAAGCAPQPLVGTRAEQSPAATSSPSATQSIDPTQEPTTTPTPVTPEPSPSPSQTPAALYKPGDEGEKIREIQHRLLQLDWFQGDITGKYDEATQAAVEGFQSKRSLLVTGLIDAETLEALRGMTRTPTHDEMHNILKPGKTIMGPGSKGDDVRDLQARLRQIGWYEGQVDGIYGNLTKSAVKGFQEKRAIPVTGEVDQRTLDRLAAMTRKPTKDELNNVMPTPRGKNKAGMHIDERCTTGRAICISKKDRKLAWVIDGDVKMVMDVRFGSRRTPTREGAFSVGWKSKNHVSKLYGSEMPYALFFSGGQAVHYSSDFAARGYRGASHGCVNVRDKKAIANLFSQARVGDKVIVYNH